MRPEFISRLIGMLVFAILGARLGAEAAALLNLDVESRAVIFGLVGVLTGLIITPWITVYPVRMLGRIINEMPVERLLMMLVGASVGLILSLLAAYPLSLLPSPIGSFVPPGLMLVAVYLSMTIFSIRTREILDTLGARLGRPSGQMAGLSTRQLVLDTSVLIDGRIADVAETGFIGGTLLMPRFVLSELHRVADSSDPLRRERGRRGLKLLNQMQRSDVVRLRIVEDDFDDIAEVDNKIVALAISLTATVLTTDYNLSQVAGAQGVPVLNMNELANSVRPMFIPGETLSIRIIQEGRDAGQGVGYLEDGTMVVVETGKSYMDRTITVEVTKSITRPTGRMIFALPEAEARRLREQIIANTRTG
ncbi:MAG: PIN/TRAM domain-containing protein [Aggregatilineales bacterium]